MDFDVQYSKDIFISDVLKADFKKKKFCIICTHTSNIILFLKKQKSYRKITRLSLYPRSCVVVFSSEADGTAIQPSLLSVWTAPSSQKDYETANQANKYKY